MTKPTRAAAAQPGDARWSKFDGSLLAALATGFRGYATGGPGVPTLSIGLTIRVGDGHTAETIRSRLATLFAREGRLTSSHLQDLAQLGRAHLTADVTQAQFLLLADAPFVSEVELCANFAPYRPVPRLVADPASASAPAAPLRSAKTRIVGLIDHGCPFAHHALRTAAGQTSVFAIWDQDPVPDFPAQQCTMPAGFGYGRQVDGATLNGWIAASTSGGRIDEELCYRTAGYPVMRSRYTHGSLTVGLLAANWVSPSLRDVGPNPPANPLPNADLVFVQLPRDVPLAPFSGGIARCTIDGLRYMLDCAPDNAEVVVVVDYGSEMGPHDGSSWFEQALDAIVHDALSERNIRLRVVLPSGNSHELRRHAVVFEQAQMHGAPATLGWWIPRANDVPSLAELWFDAGHANFEFTVTPPGAAAPVIRFNAGADTEVKWPAAGQPSCVVICKQVGQQHQVVIQIAPTSRTSAGPSATRSGVWTLGFNAVNNQVAGPVHCYTGWGGRSPGVAQRIWPSRFIASASQAPNVIVTGNGSILGSGCGVAPLVIGGHEKWGDQRRADYSGAGAGRGGTRLGANLVAVTEESPCLPGLLCLGNRSASRVRARGTSFAAPQVAREMAVTGQIPVGHARPLPTGPGTVNKKKPRPDYREPRL
jgi:hypothetical protein